MKIAVISDTHGRLPPVQRVNEILAGRQDIAHVLHCGDVDESSLVTHLPRGTHFVWGNCDTDRQGIETAVSQIAGTHHGSWGQLEVAGKQIAFTHSDDRRLFHDLQTSNAFDFLFYGHTHIADDRVVGRTRVINPGALHRASVKTFIIVDVESGEVESFVVG
jgi:putative phosphoesterase